MADQKDFFISYTSVDRPWAVWIAWQLEAGGYQVVVQAWDFGAGSDWAHEMHDAMSTAERVVVVLSPDYLRSAHGEAEWRHFHAKDPSGERGLLLPIRIRQVDPPGLLTTRVYVDLVGLDAADAREALLSAVRRSRESRPASRSSQAPSRDQGLTANIHLNSRENRRLPRGVAVDRAPESPARRNSPTSCTRSDTRSPIQPLFIIFRSVPG